MTTPMRKAGGSVGGDGMILEEAIKELWYWQHGGDSFTSKLLN